MNETIINQLKAAIDQMANQQVLGWQIYYNANELFFKYLLNLINFINTTDNPEINRSLLTLMENLSKQDTDNIEYGAKRLTKALNIS